MTIHRTQFPTDFRWGAATSSYQIEGATRADGRGPSVWDTFAATPGKTRNGDSGDPGCDHYHRWASDLDLMAEMGLDAYRFSVAWPRVLPEGRGRPNEKGIAFYDRLVDGLLERGIEPWLTLHHWDLPQALQDRGGWPARDTVHAFTEYTDLVSSRLGDRVKHWMTHNEPWCTAYLGYGNGYFAPGIQDPRQALQTSHHLLLSHGAAVPVIRANSGGAQVGIALNLWPVHAASDKPEDGAAALRQDGFANRWYLDPLYGRGYPQDMLELYGEHAPQVQDGDLATIAVPTDFLGVNYYIRFLVRHEDSPPLNVGMVRGDLERTDFDWEIYPEGQRELLDRLHRDYGVAALYITENGACYDDAPEADGSVRDARRQRYLEAHVRSCLETVAGGTPLKGYFAWSLMDNFEWAEGYARRFGLVHVDFATQQRTLKQSGQWYSNFVRGFQD